MSDQLSFHLGQQFDLSNMETLDEEVHYESRDLTTHGVIVGMTGSGKTGLSINLLEEAALDNIPCIMIDPKGDLTNLLLQFPDLSPQDFLPWISPDEARLKGKSAEEYAKELAGEWKEGLRESNVEQSQIQELKDRAEYRIYTPGSEAGLPLSLLQSFEAPQGDVLQEDKNQKVDAIASALLGLSGISADPVTSREHILIARILHHCWESPGDEPLTLKQLIKLIQNPPFDEVGALDLETFYREKDRMKLAIALNNILASPGFSTWLQGEPLDLDRLLKPNGKKTKHLIFYLAHLDDTQRMFFVTLLLSEVLSWTRKQKGTTHLRALLYFDEVFGYLPPHPGNPPSKQPLMTLLKQARAFGVGVLLATQNPVDLDYKALSNAGTWFVGKLQTERDKARLLDGLESVAVEQGASANRAEIEKTISALGKRVFLYHNIHRGERPTLFRTRWALSYLRGPMSREEISKLMEPHKQCAKPSVSREKPAEPPMAIPVPPPTSESASPAPVALPPDLPVCYLPTDQEGVSYRAQVIGVGLLTVTEKKMGREHSATRRFVLDIEKSDDWKTAVEIEVEPAPEPTADAKWTPPSPSITTSGALKKLEKTFRSFLGGQKVSILHHQALGMSNRDGEDREAFLQRCRPFLWQDFLKELQSERETYSEEFDRYGATVPEDTPVAENASWEDHWKGYDADSPVLRCSPKRDLSEAEKKELANLEMDWHREKVSLAQRWRERAEQLKVEELKPRKSDIKVLTLSLIWMPE